MDQNYRPTPFQSSFVVNGTYSGRDIRKAIMNYFAPPRDSEFLNGVWAIKNEAVGEVGRSIGGIFEPKDLASLIPNLEGKVSTHTLTIMEMYGDPTPKTEFRVTGQGYLCLRVYAKD